MDMEPMMAVSLLLEIYSVALLVVLLHTYLTNFRQLKCKFTCGLVAFALFLLLHDIVEIYASVRTMDLLAPFGYQAAFALAALQALGLTALAWITWQP